MLGGTVLIAGLVPLAALVLGGLLRHWLPRVAADLRGIALQTVIIMVVLLAVAGAVAGVLLARGGDAVADIEAQQISRAPSDYSRKALCEAAGFYWPQSVSSNVVGTHCVSSAPPPAPPPP